MLIFVYNKCIRFSTFRINGFRIFHICKTGNRPIAPEDMQQVKDFLNFIDVIVGTFWSLTVMDLYPLIFSGQITISAISNISTFVNLLLAIAGLVYLVFRIIHFVRMSRLHIEYKKQEILEKKNANFYKKFHDEFLEPKINEPTGKI